MKYKGIDVSQASLYCIDEDLAKEVIDWRASIKRPMTQRVFNSMMKQATECALYGATQEEAVVRWMESGWTGMKRVLAEYKREGGASVDTRSTPISHDLKDRSWAE